jgi:hypothetical protein
MNGDARYEDRLREADPARFGVYLSLRERDARCDSCKLAGVCPDAWEGTLTCPDLQNLSTETKGENDGT